jgi:hypothetical protein
MKMSSMVKCGSRPRWSESSFHGMCILDTLVFTPLPAYTLALGAKHARFEAVTAKDVDASVGRGRGVAERSKCGVVFAPLELPQEAQCAHRKAHKRRYCAAGGEERGCVQDCAIAAEGYKEIGFLMIRIGLRFDACGGSGIVALILRWGNTLIESRRGVQVVVRCARVRRLSKGKRCCSSRRRYCVHRAWYPMV